MVRWQMGCLQVDLDGEPLQTLQMSILSEILKCFIHNLFAMPEIKEAFGNGTVGPPGFLAGVDG